MYTMCYVYASVQAHKYSLICTEPDLLSVSNLSGTLSPLLTQLFMWVHPVIIIDKYINFITFLHEMAKNVPHLIITCLRINYLENRFSLVGVGCLRMIECDAVQGCMYCRLRTHLNNHNMSLIRTLSFLLDQVLNSTAHSYEVTHYDIRTYCVVQTDPDIGDLYGSIYIACRLDASP